MPSTLETKEREDRAYRVADLIQRKAGKTAPATLITDLADLMSDDDQVVPYADSAPLSAKLLKNGTLKTYKGFPHGCPTTQADTINADLLAFLQSGLANKTAA